MSEHPKKRKRKTSYPSRYSGSAAVNRSIENNGIFFDHCYSVCSSMQTDPKISESDDEPSSNGHCEDLCETIAFDSPLSPDMMPAEVTIGEEDDIPSPVHEEEEEEEDIVVEDDDEQASSNSSTENVVEKSQTPNITLPQKWPLLRANNCGLFKCEQCDFNSKYFSDLKQHMILKHKCEESNVCKVCKQSFPTDDLLLEHSKVHEEDPYSCKYCDFKTSVFENLSQHVADIHFNDFLYWCEQCDLQFCTSSELYLHFQEHSCDEQYLCQFCEHETNDPEDLHSHVVNEHACKLIELSDTYNNSENGQFSLLNKISFDKSKNFFVCQVCGFRSRLHANVNRHVAIEHTRFFPHVCDDCGKGFSGMLEYTKHLNLHLSEGVFLCQYCEYSTGQLEDLKTHLDFRHATNLPYKCNECLLRFGSDGELKTHFQTHEKV